MKLSGGQRCLLCTCFYCLLLKVYIKCALEMPKLPKQFLKSTKGRPENLVKNENNKHIVYIYPSVYGICFIGVSTVNAVTRNIFIPTWPSTI